MPFPAPFDVMADGGDPGFDPAIIGAGRLRLADRCPEGSQKWENARSRQIRRQPAMVTILAPVLTDGLPMVEAVCAQAMPEGVHSFDAIINILTTHATLALQRPSSRRMR